MHESSGSHNRPSSTTSTIGTHPHLWKVDSVRHSMPQVVSEYSTFASIADFRPNSHGGSINVQSAAERSSRRSTRLMPSQELKLRKHLKTSKLTYPGGTIIQ